jgi:IS5 family transposase
MEQVVRWAQLCALIEPVYPKGGSGEVGRPPVPLERMLRIYLLQLWFNLSDPAVEEALYNSAAMRSFARVDLGREPAPDETAVCNSATFWRKHKLGEALNRHLHEQGIKVSRGTVVDASIISAPSSTKNKSRERDPEMHQTANGEQWYFGMKAHIGVDSKEKIIHTVNVSAANVADALALPQLLHGREMRVYGDQAYRGQGDVIRQRAPKRRTSLTEALSKTSPVVLVKMSPAGTVEVRLLARVALPHDEPVLKSF